ncbi:MAG: zinc-ribbon domain-containing protein [Clostridiales bacterium]|nr:zinc-ribbon domain-containing protein [Clostridiales bacterium]
MIYCQMCGKPLADGSRFCDGCGSPIVSVQNNPEPPKKSKKGPIIAVILISAVGLTILGAGIFAIVWFAGKAKASRETEETYSYTESSEETEKTSETTDDILTTGEPTDEPTDETTEETTEETTGETSRKNGKTLEEAIDPEELQKTIDNMKESDTFKNTYKDATIVVSGNTITYKYYYKMTMTDDEMAQVKENIDNSGLGGQIDGMKNSFELAYGVRPEKIAFEYYTADGILITCVEG